MELFGRGIAGPLLGCRAELRKPGKGNGVFMQGNSYAIFLSSTGYN